MMNKILLIIVMLATCLATAAQRKKVVQKEEPLTDINPAEAINDYKFKDAEKFILLAIEKLQKKQQSTIREEELLETARKGRIKLQATEQVMIIDSLVLPKDQVLQVINISPECGSIHPLNTLSEDMGSFGSYFQNELGDKRLFAQPNHDGKLRLVESLFIDNEWSTPSPLKGFDVDETDNYNFPFMLTDGLTMYFAAENNESLGGYDIYMTRYDTDNQKFLIPDNIGMPFNSPYNDYLYVIDEFNNLGYFVSDRYQHADSVCLYTFIPNEKRTIYNIEQIGEKKLRSLARINNIKDTWYNPDDVKKAQARLAETRNPKTDKQENTDFVFVVNDELTCHAIDDFKKEEVKPKVMHWIKNIRNLETKNKELARLRERYASATPNQKMQFAPQIRLNEEKIEQMQRDLHDQEKEIRKIELNP